MKIEWKSCFKVGASIFLLYLCTLYWQPVIDVLLSLVGAATPLIIGGAIAYVLNIPMNVFEKLYFPKSKKKIVLKTRRPICITVSIFALLAILSLVIGLIVPELASAIMLLVEILPSSIEDFLDWADLYNLMPESLHSYLDAINWENVIDAAIDVIKNGFGDVMNFVISTVTSVVSWVVTLFLSVIFAIYILMSKEKLGSQVNRLMNRFLRKKWCHKAEYVLHVLNDCFHRFIVGETLEACILGSLCTLGMLILQLPYATMIGALVAVTALIPVAGAYIGGAVGAIMVLTESPIKAVIFVVFLVILQQIEGNLIYPRVVGSSLGLPSIWVLAAITIGGGVAGILGMLLGVPIATALYRMLRHDMRKYEAKAAVAAETSEPAAEAAPSAATKESPVPVSSEKAAKKKKKKGRT